MAARTHFPGTKGGSEQSQVPGSSPQVNQHSLNDLFQREQNKSREYLVLGSKINENQLRESDKLGMHMEQKQATVSKVGVVGTEMRLKASPRVATEPAENVFEDFF